MDGNTVEWLCSSGTAGDYPAWRTKFTAFMQTKGLYKSLLGIEIIPQEIAPSEEQIAQRNAGDGAKAWRLLQQRYSKVEKPTVVSLVRQLSRLQLGEGETSRILHTVSRAHFKTYRSRRENDSLFNALVINGLTKKYEHFVVQESYYPASTFTELRTRLQNYKESSTQRKPEVESSLAVHTENKRDGNKETLPHPKVCYVCSNPGHFAKQCKKHCNLLLM